MADTSLNVIVSSALDVVYSQNQSFLQTVERSRVEAALLDALTTVMPKGLTLDSDKPDFESIILRLVQELQQSQAWVDIIPSGTGQTLLRAIAAGMSYALLASERAYQEVMNKGSSSTAILANTSLLGVRIQRNTPARVKVRFTRADVDTIYTIPRFSKFTINGVPFFNRNILTFNRFDVSIETTLYQGLIYSGQASMSGIPFEKISFGDENKLISNEDVYVFVDDIEWNRTITSPWKWEIDEEAFYERTLSNGNVEIMFGDRRYGKIIDPQSSLKIIWSETNGSASNASLSSQVVYYEDAPSTIEITGETLTTIFGGADMEALSFYKEMAPHIRPAQMVANRRGDHRAVALQYPGVVDALFRGQAELNPGKRSWMNVMGATVLTKTEWVASEWDAFKKYMEDNTVFRLEYLRLDPVAEDMNIVANIGCIPSADLDEVEQYLKEAIQISLGPRRGILGYSVYLSDIDNVLHGEGKYKSLIETVEVLEPTTHRLLTDKTKYNRIVNVTLNMSYSTRKSYSGRLDMIGA